MEALESVECRPSKPSPIEIELFIEKFFWCRVDYEDLPLGYLGFTAFGNDGTVKTIGASKSLFGAGSAGELRARATLAHEAGHGLLHAELFRQDAEPPSPWLLDDGFDPARRRIMCRREDIERGAGGYDGKWWEWQANQAIGGLLLPHGLVEECVEPLTRPSGLLGLPELPDGRRGRAVRRVASTFDVNPVVARIRLDAVFPPGGQGLL